MKSFAKRLATLWLLCSALVGAQAAETPVQPADQATVQIAWDRVGSPVNPVG